MKIIHFTLLLCVSTLLSSCAYQIAAVPTQHIVMVESSGRLMDPTGVVDCQRDPDTGESEYTDKDGKKCIRLPTRYSWDPCDGRMSRVRNGELDEPKNEDRALAAARHGAERNFSRSELFLEDIFSQMDEEYARQSELKIGHPKKTLDPRNEGRRKLLFFIHGGLNNNRTSIERARRLAGPMIEDGYYPIFLNWQSNLVGALYEHLVNVRQGDHKGLKQAYLAPFYLAGDLGKGVGRAPAVWFHNLSRDLDRIRHRYSRVPRRSDQIYCRLRDEYRFNPEGDTFRIAKGDFAHTYREGFKSTVKYTPFGTIPIAAYLYLLPSPIATPAWLPLKYVASPFLDGLGGPSWDAMYRHALLPFHSDGVTRAPIEFPRVPQGTGGYSRFFTKLENKMAGWKQQGVETEITIIAHSMGAIVATQILKNFPDLEIKELVFMAAACSVRDYEETVLPYMDRHPYMKMYHLTLHDFAEVRDQYFHEVPPSGSLLVWIDEFLAKPLTMRDRTAGRFDNLLPYLEETPRRLKKRIHIKTFGVGEDLAATDPQKHGGFGNFDGATGRKFWSPEFRDPDEKGRKVHACPAEPSPLSSSPLKTLPDPARIDRE